MKKTRNEEIEDYLRDMKGTGSSLCSESLLKLDIEFEDTSSEEGE